MKVGDFKMNDFDDEKLNFFDHVNLLKMIQNHIKSIYLNGIIN